MNKTQVKESQLLLDHWGMYEPLNTTQRAVIGVIMIVSLVAGTIGNSTVLVLFSKYKSLRSLSNTLVVNLTVADLSMCILTTPVMVLNCFREQYSGYIECYYYAFMTALTGFVSILTFTALAVDRCIVIGRDFPIRHRNDSSVLYGGMVFIWLTAGIGATLPLLGFGSYVLEGSGVSCTFDFFTRTKTNISYNLLIQILFFALPLSIIILAYLVIFLKVRSHEKQYSRFRTGKQFDETVLRRIRKSRKLEKNELKAARSSLVLITVFCVSWLPYSIVCYYALFGDTVRISPLLVTVPSICAKFSPTLNPIFYTFVNKRFRRKLVLLFSKQCRKSFVTQRINISNDFPLVERRLANTALPLAINKSTSGTQCDNAPYNHETTPN